MKSDMNLQTYGADTSINIIAGFFGMNVGGIPFSESKHGFWLMVLFVAGFTGLAAWWTFRGRSER